MGKTIMLSALIQTARGPEAPAEDTAGSSRAKQLRLNNAFRVVQKPPPQQRRGPSATLIVAPTSLLAQWAEELQRSSKPGTIKVLVWHGTNRLDLDAAVDEEDVIHVIVTSYGTLVSEHAKHEKMPSSVYQGMYLRDGTFKPLVRLTTIIAQSNGSVSLRCLALTYRSQLFQGWFSMRRTIASHGPARLRRQYTLYVPGEGGRSLERLSSIV